METVGVVGLGIMGAGIAEVFARAGLRVIGVDIDEGAVSRGRGHLESSTGKAVERGRLGAEERAAILGRITLTDKRDELADADLVIEAVPEVMELKRALFADLDRICKPSAVLATNTSSLSVTTIAANTSRPGRVVGMHFFNPAPVMKLVEVVTTVLTEDGLGGEIAELATRLGKTPIVVGDRAGFVANRLLLGYLNQACRMLEEGVASRDGIDTAMRVGAGLPMGPFQLLDLIGLDTSYEICEVLFYETKDRRHAPSPLLRELVTAGMHGRKSGQGFHPRTAKPTAPPSSGPKVTVTTIGVVGDGVDAELLRERLDTAGFKTLDGHRDADIVLAVTAPPVVDVAVRLPNPERVVGIHLVGAEVAEVVHTVLTAPEIATVAQDLARVMGRTPVACADRAGLVVNALLFPYLNDAVRMVESGYASFADVDTAMKLGCGYPQGPFEMLEAFGLETVRDGLRALYAEYREPSFAPAPLLERLVAAGMKDVKG
ncbi:3-hydroxyacyl-CoA dehydrogenase NAD-binding domain-containing protein [Acrocarpospora sp. B8E8]|uniref:3-hydroxyacyl-CoA dehydrogenase n=1 Tax=Acrocarpospora sp. B8E8 TaxID=3153572 RepID=UPI00325E6254